MTAGPDLDAPPDGAAPWTGALPMLRRRFAPGRLRTAVLVTVAGLAVLTAAQAFLVAPGVERDLRDRTTQALAAAGLDGIGVRVDGRDVTLTGAAPDVRTAARAEQVAFAVEGVRFVDGSGVTIGPAAAPAPGPSPSARPSASPSATPTPSTGVPAAPSGPTTTLVAVTDGGEVLVGGVLPGAAGAQRIADRLAQAFGAGDVRVTTATSPDAPDDGAEAFAETVAALGEDAEAVTVTLAGGRIVLTGTVASGDARAAALAAARSAVADDAAVDDRLRTGGDAAAEVTAQLDAMPPVPFADLSTTPGPIARSLLDAVAFVLANRSDAEVLLVGHSADTGDADADAARARSRAEAAEDYLASAGVAVSRVEVDSAGSGEPAAAGDSPAATAANHRVVVRAAP